MEILPLELYPSVRVSCALFSGVTNAAELRERLVAGTLACECALVDANVVLSIAHVFQEPASVWEFPQLFTVF